MEQNFCVHCMNAITEDQCSFCGKNINDYQPASHHLRPGTILGGKYMVGAVLGEGGFGITYIGRDINLDLKVAIKEYFPSGVVNRNNASSAEISVHVGDAQTFFEKGKNSFLSEARTLAKFSNEHSIVSVWNYFSENNTAYIVMEYLEGIDLRDYIVQNGKMTFEQTVSIISPIMTALSKIHTQGLIHRDISPANIMILNDGTAKLLDFGAAREVGGGDEKSLSILLKPGYAPEEQYRNQGNQGTWTDVYALSATMYRMMTGVTPIDAMNRIFADDLRKISELNPTVTPEQEAIIMKGMAIWQADRYQTIGELHSACTAGVIGRKTEISYAKDNKKPNIPCFIGSIVTGLIALYFVLNTVSNIIDEVNPVFSVIFVVVFGVLSAFLGKFYFSRIDNKKRKPNIFCLVGSILSTLFTVFCAWLTYVNFTDVWAEEGAGEFGAGLTVISLVFPIFFGYFYYPRLERKKRNLFIKVYSSIVATAVVILVIGIVFVSVNTVTIGDQNIKRNETTVRLSVDIITNNELEKLKELKNLENLEIFESFLDDEDVKIIGELTQLKQLSLRGNTDITNVAPLNNLANLTYLNISNTKTTDISCLDKLVNLETLDIDNTDVANLGILSRFTKLDTLHMESLDNLDVTTISLPETVYTLYCSNNKLENLEFVSGSKSLANIYASNNNISDLTPLSGFDLIIVELAANNISDLSPLNVGNINNLDVSTNSITDISCLKGIPAYELDLAYNQITDISALTENYRLGSVNLNNNQITDISPLKDCFNIWLLNISYNQIEDISALATIDDLYMLEARGNKIADISSLTACKQLIEEGYPLELRDNRISDISALAKYINTDHMYLSGNNISDVSPLQACTALEILKLNDNNITDISPLNLLENLRVLEIVNNPITSLENLRLVAAGDSALDAAVLRVSYNDGIDFTELAETDNLNVAIYDVPERQKDSLRELGFWAFPTSEELDEEEENDDLIQEETNTEDTNG